ncbi:TetR/AcrR family transcriptional regulator [Streptomyces hainanensis]|uniref:TetR family transcriptional regulator n=1 Tax=Streptomyces hainanensis TaxID=402648 RepID=A0A4R4TMX8_9ACTN|nr:TetR family transcriptional regulator [Streptomyces hainanensis]TDC79357.1 TetR family transcriptional regulator [Streptomyces hainanensis]
MTRTTGTPNDPTRRDRIIDAALTVIAERGVVGTTHRRVAEAAGVPLGSMTYHFDGMRDLLVAAFTRLAESMSARYRALLDAAETPQQARDAVVEIICGPGLGTPRELLLIYELYAFAERTPPVKDVTRAWMRASRVALSRHFDARTARALDALVEGLTIHNSMDADPMDRRDVAAIVDAISA